MTIIQIGRNGLYINGEKKMDKIQSEDKGIGLQFTNYSFMFSGATLNESQLFATHNNNSIWMNDTITLEQFQYQHHLSGENGSQITSK